MTSNSFSQSRFHHPSVYVTPGENVHSANVYNTRCSDKPMNPVSPIWSDQSGRSSAQHVLHPHPGQPYPENLNRLPAHQGASLPNFPNAEHNISFRISTAYPANPYAHQTAAIPPGYNPPTSRSNASHPATHNAYRYDNINDAKRSASFPNVRPGTSSPSKCFTPSAAEMLNVTNICNPNLGTPESVQYQYDMGQAGILRITQTLQPRVPVQVPIIHTPRAMSQNTNVLPQQQDSNLTPKEKPKCKSSVNIFLNKPDSSVASKSTENVCKKTDEICCSNQPQQSRPTSDPVLYSTHFCTHVPDKATKTSKVISSPEPEKSNKKEDENVHRIGPIHPEDVDSKEKRRQSGKKGSSRKDGKPRIVHIDVYCSASSSEDEHPDKMDDESCDSWKYVTDKVSDSTSLFSYGGDSERTVIRRKCSSVSSRSVNSKAGSTDHTTVSSCFSTDTIKHYPQLPDDDPCLTLSSLSTKKEQKYLVIEPPSSESFNLGFDTPSLQSSMRSDKSVTSSVKSNRPGIRRHFGDLQRPKDLSSRQSSVRSVDSQKKSAENKVGKFVSGKPSVDVFGSRTIPSVSHIRHTGPTRNQNCQCDCCRRYVADLGKIPTDSIVTKKVNDSVSDDKKQVHVGKKD